MIPLVATVLLLPFLLLPLAQSPSASAEGDATAGKALWDGPHARGCRNCHGANGEGAFGPDLAGRRLTVAQFRQAVRKPWGIMPAYVASQVSDEDIANLVAYFHSLPSVAQPGKWRFEVPPGAPRGLQIALATVGCAQCHQPTLYRTRQMLGTVNADFDWFRNIVYNHVAAEPLHWKRLEFPANEVLGAGHHLLMGNYSPARLPESLLEEIFTFARDELGFRPLVDGSFGAGVPGATGVTYTLEVENFGARDAGLAAEDVTIAVALPTGAEVVSAQGPGYQGVTENMRFVCGSGQMLPVPEWHGACADADAEITADAAVWQVPRIGPKDRLSFTFTLSKAGTASDNVHGVIRWMKPRIKEAPIDSNTILPAPIAGR